MDIYSLSRKELLQAEKEFTKTRFGRKAVIPVILSTVLTVVWAVVSLGTMAMHFLCMYWVYTCKPTHYTIDYVRSEPMSYLISFILVFFLCIFSFINYNKELRHYLESRNG